ncbi:cysteine dioxygenase family protein [Pseudomonas sp. CBC3]|uniref:cysteine dioxygenase family protein n=1 Tax=Pseudomonas sp. CBC3 TaxID=3123318 RepID=UPI0030E79DE8
MSEPLGLDRLRRFVNELTALLERQLEESVILDNGLVLLQQLVEHDDWLPAQFAEPHPEHYLQYLLHADSLQRFSVVSFVWGPGQRTPVHDHRVWGMIGMLRGAELGQRFERQPDGALLPLGEPLRLERGEVECVSPTIGDIHQVSNAFEDRVSISIHVYGGNIGTVKRAVYQADGSEKLFISGYSNTSPPNIWI